MPAASLTLKGGKQLERALIQLGEKTRKQIVRRAVKKAAAPILKTAKARAPVETGLLKISLATKIKHYKRSGTWMVIIGARFRFKGKKVAAIRAASKGVRGERKTPALYAHLVEFGTRVRSQHPGVKPQPFMRPAWFAHWRQAFNTLRAQLWTEILKESNRLALKAA